MQTSICIQNTTIFPVTNTYISFSTLEFCCFVSLRCNKINRGLPFINRNRLEVVFLKVLTTSAHMDKVEKVVRNYSWRVPGIRYLCYWERPKRMGQRRLERYKIGGFCAKLWKCMYFCCRKAKNSCLAPKDLIYGIFMANVAGEKNTTYTWRTKF